MSDSKPPALNLSKDALLASALHSQLLVRRRATLEHDIKNVVHGLLSGTELLAKSLSAPSARITPAECLSLLQQQLGRAQTTLHRILDEVAPAPQAPTEIDLAELISECTHALRHQLQLFGMQVSVPQGLKTHTSRADLKNALMYVMLDCVDRTPAHAPIRIVASNPTADGRFSLEVHHPESGAIDQESMLAAISPLLGVDATITISKSAGGERSVAISLASAASIGASRGIEGIELLIVDANRDAADSLVMLVALEGFSAEATYDNQAALQSVRSRSPKAVLVDLDGSVDSRTLIRTIRSQSGFQPRVIGLSHSQSEVIPGLDASLRKPLDPQALRRSLS